MSIAVSPLSLLFMYCLVHVIEGTVGAPSDGVGHAIVFTWLACTAILFFGSIVAAFVRRERKLWLPVAGIAATASIVTAFAVAMIHDYPD
jgi:hypothetical protein